MVDMRKTGECTTSYKMPQRRKLGPNAISSPPLLLQHSRSLRGELYVPTWFFLSFPSELQKTIQSSGSSPKTGADGGPPVASVSILSSVAVLLPFAWFQ